MKILAAQGNYYHVSLPDGRSGYCEGQKITSLGTAISLTNLPQKQFLKMTADSLSTTLQELTAKDSILVMAYTDDWYLVDEPTIGKGWIKKPLSF